MSRPLAAKGGERNPQPLNPLGDAEHIAHLVVQEAKTSLPRAGRIIGKLIAVSIFGFVLASNCCLSQYLVPIGVLILAIAAGWLDALGNECSCHRFFPYKSLNSVGASLFRWQWIVLWTCILYGLSSTGSVSALRFALPERLWKVSVMGFVPLALMLLGRALEPFRFRRARADIQKAEMLVRQLVATQTKSDISALAPLIESDQIPLYKLGSVAKLLYSCAVSYDAADKLTVDLAQSNTHIHEWPLKRFLSMVYSPARVVASDILLWESRDIVLYVVVALYLALVYLGSYYFPFAPLFALVPFMGPKSKAGRYVRDLQENIRLAQGIPAEKKGGMTPASTLQEYLPSLNWPMLMYVSSLHVMALYVLVVITAFDSVCPIFGQGAVIKSETFVFAAVLYVCSALGITAGVHRLWAHKSYKAGLPLRVILMIFNSMANQGSIFHWARDHRVHHLYSDTIADPHDANRGFWFSHVGWLVFKKNPAVLEAGKKINMGDLQNDPVVMLQKTADPFWNLLWCFAFPAFVSMSWGETLWNGFLLAGVLRYVALLNATWAVNSVVHACGTKPYNPSHRTTENGWVSLFAIGEGWHNWHHAFPYDYAAAELGALSQFNPTKVFIDAMAWLGFAWDRKSGLEAWTQRKARWEASQGRRVLESTEGPPLFKKRVITFGPAPYGDDAKELDAPRHDEQ
jgi:stearoyl-CoA desaturase (delta-9 desaturase)